MSDEHEQDTDAFAFPADETIAEAPPEPPALPVEPSPDLPAMHMAFQERIVACLKGFIATVPQAGGMAPMVQMLERDFHRLRDLAMPPAPPPEVEAPQQDHS